MIHDSAIKELFVKNKNADRKVYVNSFLSTFSTNRFNSSLYALAIMRTFPVHNFVEPDKYANIALDCRKHWNEESLKHQQKYSPCPICSSSYESEETYNMDWYFNSGLPVDDIYELLYVITETNNTNHVPCDKDFSIFRTIIETLSTCSPEIKIREAHKQMKKMDFFKEWVCKEKEYRKSPVCKDTDLPTPTSAMEEKLKFVLETLGACGILHSQEYLGAFYQYTNPASAPRSSHSSDWKYPVDFWKGENGIDWSAFHYWFGEYNELKCIIR